MSDLNLLPSEAKFQAERIHIKTIINNFLWVFGGIWLLLLLIVFVVNFILQLFLNKLNNDYQKNLTQYQSLIGNMATNQKIKYQAKIVGKVLTNRFKYGESMEMVKSLFPENIIIKNLEIQEIKKFMIYGSLKNGQDLSEVESIVVNINKNLVEGFESAKMMDVSVDAVKGWLFNMEVVLK